MQNNPHSRRGGEKYFPPFWAKCAKKPSQSPAVTPPCENGIAERPQTLRYSEIKNNLSADYGQSKAEAILNRPALGGLHHKIRAFGDAVLRKIALLQRHPPGGKIRVTRALPRL